MRVRLASILGAALAATALCPVRASAQSADERIAALERIVAQQNQRIAELERQVQARDPAPVPAVAATTPVPAPVAIKGLDVSGDMRVRFEQNWSARVPDRGRGTVRLRLGATYDLSRVFSVGVRLVTGDPDDPNSTDITLSNFDDDFAAALDQAYIRARFGRLELTAGKVPQVFRKTELLWDDDVNPQGLSAKFDLPLGGGAAATLRGLYFIVDENAALTDSAMVGGQAGIDFQPAPHWLVQLSGSYYAYRLHSLTGGDSGDFGGNLRGPQGAYLSDYRIGDVLGSVRWDGLGARWPLTVTADLVHNYGAVAGEGDGLALLASLGRIGQPGDWQLGYSFMRADADAVLAAFSHDNIPLSTGYLLHGLNIDHVLRPNLRLNATWYLFRPQPSAVTRGAIDEWANRLRLSLMLGF